MANGLPEIDFALDIEGAARRFAAAMLAPAARRGRRRFVSFTSRGAGSRPGEWLADPAQPDAGWRIFIRHSGWRSPGHRPPPGAMATTAGVVAARAWGALFVHGSVVLSAVSIVDSCAQGGMGGLGIADRSYPGGGGGGLERRWGAPLAGNPDNTNANKAAVAAAASVARAKRQPGAVSFWSGTREEIRRRGLWARNLGGPAQGAGRSRATKAPRQHRWQPLSADRGGNRGLGGQGRGVNLFAGRYLGSGGSGGQLSCSSGTCGAAVEQASAATVDSSSTATFLPAHQ